MKIQTSGTLNVPASGIPVVSESVNALTEQVNDLKKLSAKVCGFKKNSHLCNDFHFEQAEKTANRLPLAFFIPIGYLYSSDPRVER